jgi:hypothetical protein
VPPLPNDSFRFFASTSHLRRLLKPFRLQAAKAPLQRGHLPPLKQEKKKAAQMLEYPRCRHKGVRLKKMKK